MPEAAGHRRMRADARRNVAAILDAATEALIADPRASMAEVAVRAGLNRATLYRHFPTREDLVRAIHMRALDEAGAVIAASRPDEGPALDALRRAFLALLRLAERYRTLIREADPKDEEVCRREDEVVAPVLALVRRAQREGSVRADVPPEWVVEAHFSLLLAAFQLVEDDVLGLEDVAETVTSTILEGVRTPDRKD